MHPCDLDLLLFFNRHPKALVSSERIAAFVGYDLAQVAKSLDLLEGAGVLRRSVNRTHVGRLYSFIPDGDAMWLGSILRAASTPDRRRQMIRLLQLTAQRQGQPPGATKEGASDA